MSAYVKIGGVRLPDPIPSGLVIGHEPIWSVNTGRAGANAEMQGTIIAVKKTISVTFVPLTQSEISTITNLLSSVSHPFRTVQYDNGLGESDTITCYTAPWSITSYGMINNEMRTVGFAIELIEK